MKTIPIWMCNEIISALSLAEDKYMKESNNHKWLAAVAKEKDLETAKKIKDEWDSNPFHPLGRIAAARKLFEKEREKITKKFKS